MEIPISAAADPAFDRRTTLTMAAFASAIDGIAAAAGRVSDIVGLDAVSRRDMIRARKLSCVEALNASADVAKSLTIAILSTAQSRGYGS
ncbi:MAG: hypothetical protein JWO25_118 [Alphaproteobacteria bacterium]|nr:hypothetical protein [Alphaproteobacteria bacterium]